MKYAQLDRITGNIIALETDAKVTKKLAKEKDWFAITDNLYKAILENNGKYRINTSYIDSYDENHMPLAEAAISKSSGSITSTIIAKMARNLQECQIIIDGGITYRGVRYPFALADRVRYAENIFIAKEKCYLPNDNVHINTEDGIKEIPLKIHNLIYKLQIEMMYYNESYVKLLNEYISTLNNPSRIRKIPYGISLPEKYENRLLEIMNNYLIGGRTY